jgi:hypothetical protein
MTKILAEAGFHEDFFRIAFGPRVVCCGEKTGQRLQVAAILQCPQHFKCGRCVGRRYGPWPRRRLSRRARGSAQGVRSAERQRRPARRQVRALIAGAGFERRRFWRKVAVKLRRLG